MSSKIIGLACSFLGLFAFLVYITYDNHSFTSYDFYRLPSSANPFIGSSFTESVEFAEHDDYKNLAHKYDYLWDDLLTPNGGFLIKFEQDGTTRRHGIGMFHQLHCLKRIRGALQSRQPGQSQTESQHEGQHDGHGGGHDEENHDSDEHILHCVDYLRQTILCMADDTIETPKRNPDGKSIIDGMFTHQCRSSRPVYDLALNSPPYYAPSS